jgi:GNAT superfamily N-acetyltransferase
MMTNIHPGLRLHEITTVTDDLLLPWLDLYERAFPEAERIPVSRFLSILKARERGEEPNRHLLCALSGDQLIGLAAFNCMPEVGALFLWYIAVPDQARGQGVGSWLYRAVVEQYGANLRAMIFDLEDPALIDSPLAHAVALRRVNFYRRLGAHILTGIDYVQRVSDYQPPIRMLLMLHPFQPLDAPGAYALARQVVGEAVSQTADLVLD